MELTPLWKLNKQIRQEKLELELLKKDPSTNYKEITELDTLLSRHKLELIKRKNRLNSKN